MQSLTLLWQICQSVCLSITLWYYIKTNAHIVKIFPLSGKGMTRFMSDTAVKKITRGTPSAGMLNTRGPPTFWDPVLAPNWFDLEQ